MKLALTLSGGGAKGAYEIGAFRALQELDYEFDIITGTSIGAINAVMLVQGEVDRAEELWQSLTMERIFDNDGVDLNSIYNIDYLFENRESILPLVKKYITSKGADITPFKKMINEYANEEKFFKSPVDFGLITVRFPSLFPVEIKKSDIMPNYLEKWVLASASCFPAFPLCEIDGEKYADGMYYDNTPIETAFRLGADKVIAIALKPSVSQTKFVNHPQVSYIEPAAPLGMALSFEQNTLQKSLRLGYLDAMKTFGKFYGNSYTFRQDDGKALGVFGNALWSKIARFEALGSPEKQRALKISGNAAPITSYLDNIIVPSRNTVTNKFVCALEVFMNLHEYDPLSLYGIEEVLADFKKQMGSKAEDEITKEIALIEEALTNGTGMEKIHKAFKIESILFTLMKEVIQNT